MPHALRRQYDDRLTGGLQPDPAQEKALAALERLHDDVVRRRGFLASLGMTAQAVKGIYLWGGVGRGKTMLMDIFFDSLPLERKRRVHFHEFMIGVHNALHDARQKGDADNALLRYARKIAGQAKVICFDEFHVTDIADAMILGRLFTALFSHGVIVVATSNWPPERLYEGGLQRDRFLPFIDTLKNHMEIVELFGSVDYRLRALSDSGVWFHPLGEMARERANNLFSRLTGGAVVHKERLTVKGRTIDVPAAAKGVARFSFAQMCGQPLGAEDYLMVAAQYHTVFLEDVPVLGAERRNEAKRLMIFVDALYDRRTKLVVVADTEPENLYNGDDHAFEFQRTVSRLLEMQSPDYLS